MKDANSYGAPENSIQHRRTGFTPALGAAAYLAGEYDQALLELESWGPVYDTQTATLKAASLGMLGRVGDAENALNEIRASDVAFANNPGGELRRYFVVPETVGKIIEGLTRAGLRTDS